MKILYIQTAFVGDLLLSIPTLLNIKRRYPEARISLICRKGLGNTLLDLGLVWESVEIDKSRKRSPQYYIDQLTENEFDLLICPHQSLTSYRIVKKAQAETKIGYKRFWNIFGFDKRISRPMELPEALRQLTLFSEIDKESRQIIEEYRTSEVDSKTQLKKIPQGARSLINSFTRKNWNLETTQYLEAQGLFSKKYVVLAPGSVWETKRWTLQGFAEVGKFLSKNKFEIVIVGAPDEVEVCDHLSELLPESLNFSGKTSLIEAIRIIAGARLLICNDSGAMHMASLSETPTISLFGPTVLDFGYRPWNPKARVEEIDLACRPCGSHGHKVCPLGNHKCMESLSSAQVIESLKNTFSLESL